MLKTSICFIALIMVEECFSAGKIKVKDLVLVSKTFGKSCTGKGSKSTCKVKSGERAGLYGNWFVDGTVEALGLVELIVSLKWSDGVGNEDNIRVCQKTGGNFELVKNACPAFVVANGTYSQEAYALKVPASRSPTTKRLTIAALTKWSDGQSLQVNDAGSLKVLID